MRDAALRGAGHAVLHHTNIHEGRGLGARLLGLRHVQVHLVAVKVGVVRCTDALVEAERPPGAHAHLDGGHGFERDLSGENYSSGALELTHLVAHDALLVQTGLAVEQHNVAVNEVTLHNVAVLQLARNLFARGFQSELS